MIGADQENLLSRLAGLMGIEPAYFDIFGCRHETSIDTKARILAALGFDVRSTAALEAAVRAIEEEPWREGLAPFTVRTSRAAGFALDLFSPAEEASDHWGWQVVLEDGEIMHGSYRPEDLPLLAARDIAGRRIEQRRLEIRRPIPTGYHRLAIIGRRAAETILVMAPPRCYVPAQFDEEGGRGWGVSAHLYTLRSNRNWGVGDFSDLARLCRLAGELGAAAVATNPFHALFPLRPAEASPYAPSSRLFLNPIYIDATIVPGFSECAEAHVSTATLTSLRNVKMVDYPNVWAAKLKAFEALFAQFQHRHAHGDETQHEIADFHRFVGERGAALQSFAAFSVLDELHRDSAAETVPWSQRQGPYRDPDGAAVARIVRERSDRVAFHKYLQYLADHQLRAVADQTMQAVRSSWLVRDLALGTNPDGADAWMLPKAFALGLRCGAPPDDFHPDGQDWGVVPLHPLALRRDYSPFIAMLRANMRHAGGLRIDHVIGLQRQFMVPLGERPSQGCYINLPLDEMTAILALESHRNSCMVIGEDLGTVPEGFRDRMREKAIFGCAVLYFERAGDGRFKAPYEYPLEVAASASTHDLPTLVGYLRGEDIKVRRQLGIYTEAAAHALLAERQGDCQRLLEALAQAGFPIASAHEDDSRDPAPFLHAVHAFLAASSAKLFFAQLDDLLAEPDQLNMPGTVYEYPNWRRKLSVALDDPSFLEVLTAVARSCAEWGRGSTRNA